HNGGVIAFGPDNKLYAVVGENADPALAQDPLSALGKVLRMNTDGTAPSDNPYFGNASWNPLVYTYGHRNMFGLAFHPVTHRPYVTENGPNCNDEINLLPDLAGARRNFGWGPNANCSGKPPVPSFTATPNPVVVGATVTFNATASYDPDGRITAYSWDFGDSTPTDTGNLTTHAYASVGRYNVVLTVTDNESFTNRTSQTVV